MTWFNFDHNLYHDEREVVPENRQDANVYFTV